MTARTDMVGDVPSSAASSASTASTTDMDATWRTRAPEWAQKLMLLTPSVPGRVWRRCLRDAGNCWEHIALISVCSRMAREKRWVSSNAFNTMAVRVLLLNGDLEAVTHEITDSLVPQTMERFICTQVLLALRSSPASPASPTMASSPNYPHTRLSRDDAVVVTRFMAHHLKSQRFQRFALMYTWGRVVFDLIPFLIDYANKVLIGADAHISSANSSIPSISPLMLKSIDEVGRGPHPHHPHQPYPSLLPPSPSAQQPQQQATTAAVDEEMVVGRVHLDAELPSASEVFELPVNSSSSAAQMVSLQQQQQQQQQQRKESTVMEDDVESSSTSSSASSSCSGSDTDTDTDCNAGTAMKTLTKPVNLMSMTSSSSSFFASGLPGGTRQAMLPSSVVSSVSALLTGAGSLKVYAWHLYTALEERGRIEAARSVAEEILLRSPDLPLIEACQAPLRPGLARADIAAVLVVERHQGGPAARRTDARGNMALHYGVLKRPDDLGRLTRVLISAGVTVNARGEHGFTPIAVACGAVPPHESGEDPPLARVCAPLRVVEELLDNGADPSVADYQGLQPLHHAVLSDQLDLVSALHAHGADLDARDAAGRTPLHAGADAHVSVQMLSLLATLGARLAVRDRRGDTPLSLAVAGRHYKGAAFLFQTRNWIAARLDANASVDPALDDPNDASASSEWQKRPLSHAGRPAAAAAAPSDAAASGRLDAAGAATRSGLDHDFNFDTAERRHRSRRPSHPSLTRSLSVAAAPPLLPPASPTHSPPAFTAAVKAAAVSLGHTGNDETDHAAPLDVAAADTMMSRSSSLSSSVSSVSSVSSPPPPPPPPLSRSSSSSRSSNLSLVSGRVYRVLRHQLPDMSGAASVKMSGLGLLHLVPEIASIKAFAAVDIRCNPLYTLWWYPWWWCVGSCGPLLSRHQSQSASLALMAVWVGLVLGASFVPASSWVGEYDASSASSVFSVGHAVVLAIALLAPLSLAALLRRRHYLDVYTKLERGRVQPRLRLFSAANFAPLLLALLLTLQLMALPAPPWSPLRWTLLEFGSSTVRRCLVLSCCIAGVCMVRVWIEARAHLPRLWRLDGLLALVLAAGFMPCIRVFSQALLCGISTPPQRGHLAFSWPVAQSCLSSPVEVAVVAAAIGALLVLYSVVSLCEVLLQARQHQLQLLRLDPVVLVGVRQASFVLAMFDSVFASMSTPLHTTVLTASLLGVAFTVSLLLRSPMHHSDALWLLPAMLWTATVPPIFWTLQQYDVVDQTADVWLRTCVGAVFVVATGLFGALRARRNIHQHQHHQQQQHHHHHHHHHHLLQHQQHHSRRHRVEVLTNGDRSVLLNDVTSVMQLHPRCDDVLYDVRAGVPVVDLERKYRLRTWAQHHLLDHPRMPDFCALFETPKPALADTVAVHQKHQVVEKVDSLHQTQASSSKCHSPSVLGRVSSVPPS